MPGVAETPPPSQSWQLPPETDDSWRTLTPPPKTNAIAKSPLEAQIFHRMVEHLHEEELVNQSVTAVVSQAPSVQALDDSLLTEDTTNEARTTVVNHRSISLTPLKEENKSIPLEFVETHPEEELDATWDWPNQQHPRLAPFPDVGALVGTPEILNDSNPLISKMKSPHRDRFGVRILSLEAPGRLLSGRILANGMK